MIDRSKLAVVHVARKELRLDEDQYRALLRAECGVESAAQLDDAMFSRLMKRFEKLGFVSTAKQQRRDRRVRRPAALITTEQQALIDQLFRKLGWDEPSRRMGFSKRCCRKSFPQTRGDANRVIEGLKAILAREAAQ